MKVSLVDIVLISVWCLLAGATQPEPTAASLHQDGEEIISHTPKGSTVPSAQDDPASQGATIMLQIPKRSPPAKQYPRIIFKELPEQSGATRWSTANKQDQLPAKKPPTESIDPTQFSISSEPSDSVESDSSSVSTHAHGTDNAPESAEALGPNYSSESVDRSRSDGSNSGHSSESVNSSSSSSDSCSSSDSSNSSDYSSSSDSSESSSSSKSAPHDGAPSKTTLQDSPQSSSHSGSQSKEGR